MNSYSNTIYGVFSKEVTKHLHNFLFFLVPFPHALASASLSILSTIFQFFLSFVSWNCVAYVKHNLLFDVIFRNSVLPANNKIIFGNKVFGFSFSSLSLSLFYWCAYLPLSSVENVNLRYARDTRAHTHSFQPMIKRKFVFVISSLGAILGERLK